MDPGLPDLTGTVTLVTGAGGGIGSGVAERFAAAGVRPVVDLAGTASEIGDACVLLASPMARWTTGHDLVVDGGMSAVPAW